MAPILEGTDLTVRFGGLTALEGMNFQLNEGEIVGLIGPNGAGKTTLFNVISGVHRPKKGETFFLGQRLSHLKPHRICRLGIVKTYQITRPFQSLTVMENIDVGFNFGSARESSVFPKLKSIGDFLEFTGLSEKAHKAVDSLTVADRKRLEICRALATRPKVLLLDETMAGLNPREMTEAMELVRSINTELGITIFIIEHVMKAIMGLSHRILVLNYGRLIAEGLPGEIAKSSLVIEAYLGKANH